MVAVTLAVLLPPKRSVQLKLVVKPSTAGSITVYVPATSIVNVRVLESGQSASSSRLNVSGVKPPVVVNAKF